MRRPVQRVCGGMRQRAGHSPRPGGETYSTLFIECIGYYCAEVEVETIKYVSEDRVLQEPAFSLVLSQQNNTLCKVLILFYACPHQSDNLCTYVKRNAEKYDLY